MILRCAAAVAAVALLAAAAHAVVTHAGGYGTPHSIITLTLAAGVAVGALAIGRAWQARRRAVALSLALALICGEAFGLMSTAERLIAQREAAQRPLLETADKRADVQRRLTAAEAQAIAAKRSHRLDKAQDAKEAADRAVIEKAAERGCAANCRTLLEQQVANAARELEAARGDVATAEKAAAAIVAAIRAELAAIPAPVSATPLADRLGLPAWSLDLFMAGLGSIAANGLAAALLVFAGHGNAHTPAPRMKAEPRARVVNINALEIEPPAVPVLNRREHAARFGVECFAPADSGATSVEAIKVRYLAWCRAHNVAPLPDAEIGETLADLMRSAGLRITQQAGQLVVVGIALKPATELAAVA